MTVPAFGQTYLYNSDGSTGVIIGEPGQMQYYYGSQGTMGTITPSYGGAQYWYQTQPSGRQSYGSGITVTPLQPMFQPPPVILMVPQPEPQSRPRMPYAEEPEWMKR